MGDIDACTTPIAAAYYPDWVAYSRPPEHLDFSKFDILLFAFATPNSSSTISWDDGATDLLKRLVSAANRSGHGTKVVLSIGGWGGSQWFSQAMTAPNREKLVGAAASAVNTYGLAGIDIDWEYPNESGAGHPYSPSDAENLLVFFQDLRRSLGPSKIISAAVVHQPWLGPNGNPLTNVSAYASVMTYVNIMNYDVFGSSANPGPNAPLSNACGNSAQPQASAEGAYSSWTKAGFPVSKLMLGLPLYGYVSRSTMTHLSGSYKGRVVARPSEEVRRAMACRMREVEDKEVGEEEEGKVEVNWLGGAHAHSRSKKKRETKGEVEAKASGDLSGYYGQQVAFNQIVASGALVKQSNGTYVGGNGYTEGWDNCSDTPYLFNTQRSTVVTYDDTYSLADKAAYAKQQGMAGCFTWSLDQDDEYTLQDVIRSSLGK